MPLRLHRLYAKLLTTANISLNKPSAKKKQERISTWLTLKKSDFLLNIDTHDFNTKVSHAMRFLKGGDKVKVSIRFRGREMGHPEHGYDIMNRFAEALSEHANVEKPAKLEGRNMLMFLATKPTK